MRPGRVALALAVLVAAAGGAGVSAGIGTPGRSALSYLAGLAATLAVLAGTTWLVAVIAARSPTLSLLAAMGCYLITVVGFAIVLIGVDPSVVETRAVAAGLLAGVLLGTVAALRRGAVRAPDGEIGRQLRR